ncbi:hypothetical protein [Halalkalicoccus jeotgali]|uniref:Carboxypeptidase regulatory-like domain-containing protein n=1 Tax=Halalkalicoccus jeotgali (strain DSM 18796 / CECT 7217 / JCM 14584 / KCTC 4019 / B3) TaxID=795797 RepID=D8J2M9_HALJB|nr:hypothetical protein [Halalkalicoccus jeotgali]ADJ14986.1 hypothetical protein HacjB3_08005 [Halalkalicoccus jeotgali B3]ELY34998.1 hypothetical protein C497_14717 [Halalkalicoccus jeotgali B3]
MADGRGLGRRRLLRVGALGLATAAAGCSGSNSNQAPLEDGGESATYTLTVALVEDGGEPAPEASVSIQTAQLVPQADAKVPGPDGIVSFELSNGEYVIVVESQEYTNVEEPVTVDGSDVETEIVLERGYG